MDVTDAVSGCLAHRAAEAIAALELARPVVLIDGPSGAGKSTLAEALIAHWPARSAAGAAIVPAPQLVRLDDLYPGWAGLAAGSRHVADELLAPLRRVGVGRWRAWDWSAARPGAWHEVTAERPLIVEGCGALSQASARHADLAIWLTAAHEERKRRALERDRGAFDTHWQMWDEQFTRFVAAEHPPALAGLVLDSTECGAAARQAPSPGSTPPATFGA